jgi:serine/threonine protein kinase
MQSKVLGPYRLQRKLGEGGMGAVYSAVHDNGQMAAVKILPPHLFQRSGFRARFQIEIETLRKLDHTNIVKFYGYGEAPPDVMYYAMEMVEGRSLEGVMAERRFHWREVLAIGYQACKALKHAHDRGIIHRDIKPANLMLTPADEIKLSDFGIAKLWGNTGLTLDGGPIGTANYMSPEQAEGKRASNRADLYSLGCMFYALLANRPPFVSNSLVEMLHMQRYVAPDPIRRHAPQVPVEFERVIATLLEKDPEKRVPNAAVLIRLLRAVEVANPPTNDPAEKSPRVTSSSDRPDASATPIFDAFDASEESDNPVDRPEETPGNQTSVRREVEDSNVIDPLDPLMDRSSPTLPGTEVRANTSGDHPTLDNSSLPAAINSLGDVSLIEGTASDQATLAGTTANRSLVSPKEKPSGFTGSATRTSADTDASIPAAPTTGGTLAAQDVTLVTGVPKREAKPGERKVLDATSIAEVDEFEPTPTLLPGIPKGRKDGGAPARDVHGHGAQTEAVVDESVGGAPRGGNVTIVDDTPSLGRYVTAEEAQANEDDSADVPEPRQISLSSIIVGVVIAAVIAVGWWFTRPLSANELYERIDLAAKDSNPDHLDDATTNVMDFLRLYKDDPRAKEVEKIKENMEVNTLERKMSLRANRPIDPNKQLPIERAYLEAMASSNAMPENAIVKLRALVTLFGPSAAAADQASDTRLYVKLAERQIERMSKQVKGFTNELARKLDHAEELRTTDPDQARSIAQSVLDLAGNRVWGKPLVTRAGQIIAALPAATPTTAPTTSEQ